MLEHTIRFPVACPKCGRERLTEFPINDVVYALNRGSDITSGSYLPRRDLDGHRSGVGANPRIPAGPQGTFEQQVGLSVTTGT